MSAHREEAAASDSEAAVESPRDSYLRELKPVRRGLTIIEILRRDYPDDWKPAGLEKLLLNQQALDALLAGQTPLEIEAANEEAMNGFLRRRQTFLLY